MRIIIALLRWLGLFVLLTALALAIFPQWPVLQDKFTSGPARAYLDEHAVVLDYETPDGGFVLPSELYARRLITMHEIHGFADTQILDLAMMRHLHEQAGWRIYLGELSPAQAIAFNEYVLGGSDQPTRAVFDRWASRSAQWANQEFFGKLTAVREFNLTQTAERKIIFLGVDLYSDDEDISWIGETPSAPPGFANTDNILAINHALLADAQARTPETRYGEILANIERVLNFPGADRARFYGLWGLFHGGQVETAGAKPLAMHLNEEGGLLEGEVVTIGTLCISQCFNLMPSRALPGPLQGPNGEPYTSIPMAQDSTYLVRIRGYQEFADRLGEERAMLLPLREDDSPYAKRPRLIEQTGFLALVTSLEYDGSAADAFDAVVIHRASPALTPWDGEAYELGAPAVTNE